MRKLMRNHCRQIVDNSIRSVLPNEAVHRALSGVCFPGKVYLVAVGKAAWQMASSAYTCIGKQLADGIVITKYDHVKGDLGCIKCFEAGHPVLDENSLLATQAALDMTEHLCKEDTVIFLLSGGGSALFEQSPLPLAELQDISQQLLSAGASIVEINTIRKRLSSVKGGRFAQHCAPAQVFTIVLSDIIGDPLDMIASGPTYPDSSSSAQAMAVANKYRLRLSEQAKHLLLQETPKQLDNITTKVTGSVHELCLAAATACHHAGYEPIILTDILCCEAKEAGSFLGSIARSFAGSKKAVAFLAGGETVVHLCGHGKGGRNQELALSASAQIEGLENVAVFSFGSDGTDGPTDAAGGYVDGGTVSLLKAQGLDVHQILSSNNAYPALKAVDGLIMTGPTGTNVNDVAIVLVLPLHSESDKEEASH